MTKRTFGDYNIIKQIGQGCLGNVYVAEHRFIKKQYAIKVLPEELSKDKAFIQRFEREVSVLAHLDHPHIVKVHNVSYADGYYFLVMDCIVDNYSETTSLADYLRVHQCKMQESEFLSILTQVASALDYAHKKKVSDHYFVHRGLKLNNILVGKSERGLNVYVTDFGLSKIIGEGAILTRTFKILSDMLCVDTGTSEKYAVEQETSKVSKLHESFMQTYQFLSPEQKDTQSRTPLTPRVDSYAFGVLAYYLLTKKYPEGIFPMPSEILPELKLNWDALLRKCLPFNPNVRETNLSELMTQLKSSVQRVQAPVETQMPPQAPKEPLYPNYEYTQPTRAETQQDFLTDSRHSEVYQAPQKNHETLQPIYQARPQTQQEPQFKPAYQPQVATLETEDAISEPKPVLKPTEIKRPTYEEDPSSIFHLETTVARYIPKEKEIENIEPILTEMVMIPGGEYYRGSDEGARDERPKHMVRLNSFAIDKHPVTNEMFVRFLEAMGGEKDVNNNDIIRLKESRIKRLAGRLTIESGYAKHPVIGITWYGATAYAKWVGKRLPTEAEWEIAARSGLPDMIYPTGGDIERSEANFFSSDTVNVMSYPPNQFGLYDMAGNVYEWCQDWYDYSYYEHSFQEPEDPRGPQQGVYRVLRGGCWKSLKDDLTCSHRHRNNPGTVNRTYGFRCCADVK